MNSTLVKSQNLNKNVIYILAYIIIFLVFMGTDFLKFNVNGINFNVAKIFMLIPSFILVIDMVKEKKLKLNLNSKLLKYCIGFLIVWKISFYV